MIGEGARMEKIKRDSEVREQAPRGLRIAALAVDLMTVCAIYSFAVSVARTRESTESIDSASGSTRVPSPAAVSQLRSEELILEVLWELGLIASVVLASVFAFRFLTILAFETTPGRKLTGLRIVEYANGRPAGRKLLIYRELLALMSAALPVINVIWVVATLQESGWHEPVSRTVVVRALRHPDRRFQDLGSFTH